MQENVLKIRWVCSILRNGFPNPVDRATQPHCRVHDTTVPANHPPVAFASVALCKLRALPALAASWHQESNGSPLTEDMQKSRSRHQRQT